MPVSRWVLVAAIGAVMGCAESPPPPPRSQPSPPLPIYALRPGDAPMIVRWQQFCEQAATVAQASWLASSRGVEGWELVSMYGGVLCYKRPVPSEPLPATPPELIGARVPAPQPAPSSLVPSILDPGF
jgi:hypothetical protein